MGTHLGVKYNLFVQKSHYPDNQQVTQDSDLIH